MSAAAIIEAEVALIDAKIAGLQANRALLTAELSRIRSLGFIVAHGITREQVIESNGGDMPHFQTVYAFAEWLRRNPRPGTWAEWNGFLYPMAVLLDGCRLAEFGLHARLSDLPPCGPTTEGG